LQLLGRKSIGRARCADARAQLDSYIEGELDARERDLVAGHLEMCPVCQMEERRLREALTLLAGYEPIDSPRDLYAGFTSRLGGAERGFRRRALQVRLAGAGALILLVGVVGASPYVRGVLFPPLEGLPTVSVTPRPSPMVTDNTPATPGQNPVKTVDKVAVVPPVADLDAPEFDIVRPDPFQSNPPRASKKPALAANSFLDVIPEKGLTARERLQGERPGSAGRKPLAVRRIHDSFSAVTAVPGDSRYISERNEEIRIGDSVTTVRTGYILDEEGRRAVVNVNIGTESVSQ
jgi:hypothetical protein